MGLLTLLINELKLTIDVGKDIIHQIRDGVFTRGVYNGRNILSWSMADHYFPNVNFTVITWKEYYKHCKIFHKLIWIIQIKFNS